MIKKLFAMATLTLPLWSAAAQKEVPLYKDPQAPTQERVEDLLHRMTVDEKIEQLSMKSLKSLELDKKGNVSKEQLEKLFQGGSIGVLESPFIKVEDIAKLSVAADKYLRTQTRLGIPAIQIAECLHGQIAVGGTIYPQAIAQGCTWNPKLIKTMASQIAFEASSTGVDQALSPLFDLARDPRYGRVEECYGEDPYLVSQMGVAFVTGMQGEASTTRSHIPNNHIMCTGKHFVAYAMPNAGINIAPVSIGMRELREQQLYPFKKVVQEANIYSMMPGYHEVDGVPMHANTLLLRNILRGEWNFNGYIFSDYGGISMLNHHHHVDPDPQRAAIDAIRAGVDLEAPGPYAYPHLKELVASGKITQMQLDSTVAHVLSAKFKAGLFDKEYTDPKETLKHNHLETHKQTALQIAEESIVLLQNQNNLLPLDKNQYKSIAVVGPNANQVQFGDYSVTKLNEFGTTVLDGIKQQVGEDVTVNYAPGCGISSLDTSRIAEAVEAAKKSDIVVLAIGGTSIIYSGIGWGDENADTKDNTCGEGLDRTSINPPGVQPQLIREIVKTGKPVVLVMLHGRAYSIPWEKEHIPAIVDAWYPGEAGGTAIGNILFGKTNPSGRLSVSIPRSVGHIPTVYDYKPSGRGYYHSPGTPLKPGRDYVFSSPSPLFPFGYGLSYTSFQYSNMKIQNTHLKQGEDLIVSVDVTNTGKRNGKEVVQLYIHDKYASVSIPSIRLRAFDKIELHPNETRTVELHVKADDLALWNREMQFVEEPGEFEALIGYSAENIALKMPFEVVE